MFIKNLNIPCIKNEKSLLSSLIERFVHLFITNDLLKFKIQFFKFLIYFLIISYYYL